MNSKAITQHYWDKQSQIIQPPKQADKPRNEQKKQSFLSVLKKQFAEDSITVILVGLSTMFGLATVVVQIGKWQGW